jgi:site-specific recombinase XerD
MEIDNDIPGILMEIACGSRTLEKGIEMFLSSLPGYNNQLHRKPTVKKYSDCLRDSPRSFLKFMNSRSLYIIETIQKEDTELFKIELLNNLNQQTVRPYITALRLFLQFLHSIGWMKEDWSAEIHVPRVKRREHIKTIPKEVTDEILGNDWGVNSFTIARNNLIARLFINRGLHPKEFPTITESQLHPYEDLAYITVYGKRDVPRDVMLDPDTFQALRIYMIERAHFMHVKKIHTVNIFLSLNPHNGSWAITTAGVQAVVRRIKEQLKLKGCLWDLSAVNAQGCRRTAVSADYEKAEDSPIHHPEFTLSGQYGHSLTVAQKYYWKKSLKNAYRFIRGSHPRIEMQQKQDGESKSPQPDDGDIRRIFPSQTFFNNFGVGI